jgi:adenylate kinase
MSYRPSLGVLLLLGPLLAPGCAARPPAVLFVGPPGSGKSTQAELLARSSGLPRLSTGDLLRAEAAHDERLAASLAAGALVEDAAVNRLVERRLEQPDCAAGLILDGYPRTAAQAAFLDGLLARRGFAPATVVYLEVPDEVLIERLTLRARADDTPEAIARRLAAFHAETAPLLAHYPGYHRVRGDRPREEVLAEVNALLPARARLRSVPSPRQGAM